ncbi:MAG: RNA polymerase sigma factor [Oscillospiraceae bacterium]|nr:RNA polymerase sigma factor [Oscillospiraceae bacterium]
MEDSDIVELYLSRDESAIGQTAAKYGVRLRRIAGRILEDDAAAEECENDTYMQAWLLIPPNEPRTYLFAFLGRIVRHLAIDECRRRSSEKRSAVFCELTREMEACIPSKLHADERLEAGELRRILDAFLAESTETQRNVFILRYWYFDSIREICGRYGFTQSKVKSTLSRMRLALRERLEREGYPV